ncbi:MAG: VOC family protein [Gammaproteobacteria bacterium]|nr:VOC family protein [Gammaproteobacteria bacterium]NNC96790.1 VOC family protein [Gammaproteobacteria bacterium]NNM13402.1 VOC family protein [Gammaproteobacteria bacterium]
MFSHVMLGAKDIQESKKFYDAILGVVGCKPGVIDEKGRCFYVTKTGVFGISIPIDGKPVSHANGGTIGFATDSPEQTDAWHAAGLANGGVAIEDPPGIREGGNFGDLYLAYLRDPAGNKVCALHRVR